MKHGPTRTIFAAIAIACCVHRFTVQSYRAWPASKSFAGYTNSPSSNHLSSFTTRSSLRLAPGVDYLDDTTQIGAGARSSLNIDVDYLGMINFCLRSSDNGLSGPSINKLMNEITNDAFRALMIGYDPAIEITLLGFSTFTQQIQSMSDPQAAMTYLSWIEKLLINGEIVMDFSVTSNGSSSPIDSEYQKGYSRLLSLLKDAGCKVYESGLGRPKPQDSNICLSLLDLSRAEGVQSRTLELNTISNCVSKVLKATFLYYIFMLIIWSVMSVTKSWCFPILTKSYEILRISRGVLDNAHYCDMLELPSIVFLPSLSLQMNSLRYHSIQIHLTPPTTMHCKAMLYGTQKDKNYLAYSLETLAPEFSVRWKVPLDGQESLYIRSLAVLLRSGLSVASEAITYMFPLPAKQGVNGSAVDVGPMDLSLDIPPLRLHDTYQVETHAELSKSKRNSNFWHFLEAYLTNIEWYTMFSAITFEHENMKFLFSCDFDNIAVQRASCVISVDRICAISWRSLLLLDGSNYIPSSLEILCFDNLTSSSRHVMSCHILSCYLKSFLFLICGVLYDLVMSSPDYLSALFPHFLPIPLLFFPLFAVPQYCTLYTIPHDRMRSREWLSRVCQRSAVGEDRYLSQAMTKSS